MVMHGDDPDVSGFVELLADPGIAVAADPALVDVGLRGIEPRNREAGRLETLRAHRIEAGSIARVRLSEVAAEVDVADVATVVVARDDDLRELDLVDPARSLLVLPLVAVGREVTRDDDDVRLHPPQSFDDRLQRFRKAERAADVNVADLRDAQRDVRDRHHVPPTSGR